MSLFKINLQLFATSIIAGGEEEPAGTPGEQKPAEVKTFDETYVKGLRDEAAKHRTKYKELEKKTAEEKDNFKMEILKAFGLNPDPKINYESQIEQYKKAALEAEIKANQKLINVAVNARAIIEKAKDPDDLIKFLDITKLEVEDTGKVKGLDEQIKELKEKKPYLFDNGASIPTSPGGTNPAGGSPPIPHGKLAELEASLEEARKKRDSQAQIQIQNEIWKFKTIRKE